MRPLLFPLFSVLGVPCRLFLPNFCCVKTLFARPNPLPSPWCVAMHRGEVRSGGECPGKPPPSARHWRSSHPRWHFPDRFIRVPPPPAVLVSAIAFTASGYCRYFEILPRRRAASRHRQNDLGTFASNALSNGLPSTGECRELSPRCLLVTPPSASGLGEDFVYSLLRRFHFVAQETPTRAAADLTCASRRFALTLLCQQQHHFNTLFKILTVS